MQLRTPKKGGSSLTDEKALKETENASEYNPTGLFFDEEYYMYEPFSYYDEEKGEWVYEY